jgi:hypothetical protein
MYHWENKNIQKPSSAHPRCINDHMIRECSEHDVRKMMLEAVQANPR